MQPPGSKVALDRDELVAVIGELIDARQLLERLGGDLKAVARRARP
jgi:hypothetical protein